MDSLRKSVEIREISAADSQLVDALVNRAFDYPNGSHFLQDFPIWKSPSALRLGVFEGQTLFSHVGVRFTHLKTSHGLVPVALIGGVATDSAHRGKGYSTTLLKEALARIDARGAEWTLLWGSEHEFYQKLGFTPQGIQARALIQDLAISPKGLKNETPKTGLTPTLFTDFTRRTSGVEFTAQDRDWFFEHKTVEWFYLEHPFAYVAYQRGLDLKNIVHETGGNLEGIQKLLFWVYQKNPHAEILARPAQLLGLGFNPGTWFEEPLCLARPRSRDLKWDPEFWVSGLGAV